MTIKNEIKNLIKDLTNESISLSKAFTKAKTINSRIHNNELSMFITREMNGEYDDNTLPDYRMIFGESTFEFKNAFTGLTDIRVIPLPEATHSNGKSINYRPILFSIEEIEQAVKDNHKEETYKVTFTPGQLTLVYQYLKDVLSQNNGWQLIRAWWSHSPTSFPTILFKAKQKLIDLLLEIESRLLEKVSDEKIFNEKTQFDACIAILELLEKAENKIILVDGYVDSTTLKLLSSKKESVKVELLTSPKSLSESLEVLVEKFNKQYQNLEIQSSKVFHDRFLIIDDLHFYHIGASLKDLGNKTFSFVKLKEPFMVDTLMKKIRDEWKK